MASLSLPRVLQLKKNSLDAEREQFEKFQTLAIQKAINAVETPVKEKHVRSTIIGTYQEQSAITYWMVAIRLPLQDNRIVAWKFCHVTHKLLREGHPACLDDSQRHIGMIENLGKLWVHLREGYGRLVHLYCALLVCKLRFHARNPRFPGNMHLTADELDAIAENDVNNYFQLCVELFDYMEDILNLQAAVFDSLGNARANSMTASGQCRLAALIPCAQDSSQIYDCNVRLLFRLHASLPADTLQGHRERFRQQFKKLSSFYKHASSLQYYRNLLSLPVLPSNPPNFLQQSDFGTYVTPVVTIPDQPPDEPDTVGSLIDTSDAMSQFSQSSTPDQFERDFEARESPPQPDPLLERDRLIEHLQSELKRMRSEVSQMVQERNTMIGSMREHCSRLETQLHTAKAELEEEKQKTDILSVETPEIKQKLTESEEKAKLTDEKFQKLKGAYTQLREEHIHLIRQKAEVDKMSATLRAAAAQHESAKTALQQQLNDKMKDMELLQQSASSSDEIEAYKNEIANLRSEQEQTRQKEVELETVKATMEALEIEHKTVNKESEEKINMINSELKEVKEILESVRKEKDDREAELNRIKQELVVMREKSGEEYSKVVEERDAAKLEVVTLTEKYQQEKQGHERHMTDLQADLKTLQLKLTDVEAFLATEQHKHNAYITRQAEEIDEIVSQKDAELKELFEKLVHLEANHEKLKKENVEEIETKSELIHDLTEQISKLSLCKENNDAVIENAQSEKVALLEQFDKEASVNQSLRENLLVKENELQRLNIKLSDLENNEAKLKNDFEGSIAELKIAIESRDVIIQELTNDLSKCKTEAHRTTSDMDKQINEYKQEIENLNIKTQNSLDVKVETINDLKRILTEKDEKVIELSVEMKSFANEVSKIEDELEERNAELEITKNELLNIKEEYETMCQRNDANLVMKNDEIRKLHEVVKTLTVENKSIYAELTNLKLIIDEEKQVYETKLKSVTEEVSKLRVELANKQAETMDLEFNLNKEIQRLTVEYEQLKITSNAAIQEIKDKNINDEKAFNEQICNLEMVYTNAKQHSQELETQLDELNKAKNEEIQQLNNRTKERDRENQMLASRLDHVEKEKLNAECELQDLLQHNTVLEDNVAALKKELEDARKEIHDQRRSIFRCAGDAALEVTASALTSLERGNAQESSRAAAELAAQALQDLATHTEKEDVESAARAAILAAHNAAQLSAYVTEVSNSTANLELSDKLTSECRTMLTATRSCVQSPLGAGALEAGTRVRALLQAAAAADTSTGGARSVDTELAEMDQAIETAARQIEDMLAASRTGGTGVKLEVSEKILDACTTLMGAVKILVQDARKLQQELGDPKTRLNMYRRNPQWSEGLISAAKAVVFAAKLLVTSADEAVASSGRAEGVSAAAHEVAGSTAQLVAASRARAPPASPSLARLTHASRSVAAATGAVVAAVRAGSALLNEQEALDTSALTLTATRRLEMESKVRSLELETALDAERARLAALRKRHYQLEQGQENGSITNGKE